MADAEIKTAVLNATKKLVDALKELHFFAGANFVYHFTEHKQTSVQIPAEDFKRIFDDYKTLTYDYTVNQLVAHLEGVRFYAFVPKENDLKEEVA